MKHQHLFRKPILLSIFVLLVIKSYPQNTNFDKGFIVGFNKGYCYTTKQEIFCLPPAFTPLAPLPKYPESSSSWQDGYNRGFIVGMEKRKSEDVQSNNGKINTPPQFNPYIPQSPISRISPDQAIAYKESMRRRDEAIGTAVVGAGLLLIHLLTPDPQRKIQRDLNKNQKKAMKFSKKEKKALRKYNRNVRMKNRNDRKEKKIK